MPRQAVLLHLLLRKGSGSPRNHWRPLLVALRGLSLCLVDIVKCVGVEDRHVLKVVVVASGIYVS